MVQGLFVLVWAHPAVSISMMLLHTPGLEQEIEEAGEGSEGLSLPSISIGV